MLKPTLFSLLLLLGGTLFAQNSSEAAMVRTGINPGPNGQLGDTATFFISVVPKDGWHVYSAVPSKEGAYEPAAVIYDMTSMGFKAVGELKEDGRMTSHFDDIMGGTLRFYEDKVLFSQSIILTDEEVIVTGTFDYMACNEIKCVPYTHEFKMPLKAQE